MKLDISITLNGVKNIQSFDYTFSFEKGIYALVGENAVGKSTVMSAIASTVFPQTIRKFGKTELQQNAQIKISCDGKTDVWQYNAQTARLSKPEKIEVFFNGIYEGSIFSGTRFADMKNIDEIIQSNPEFMDNLIPASKELKDALSFILHDELGHYEELYKLKNFEIARNYGLENMPYFLKLDDGQFISKYKMSSGECLLISLLNFIISTALKPTFLKGRKYRKKTLSSRMFIFVDEVELALHPSSILRLVEFLEKKIKEEDLTVLFSTHSSELIRRITPNNIFYIENHCGNAQITSPCYPQYAIRTLYDHDGYDSTILVEDVLSEIVVRKLIQDFRVKNNLLVNVIPVGAWNNTLAFQKRAIEQNAFGRDRFIFSIIDGYVESEVNAAGQYKSLRKLFLPIKSIEKYLLEKLIETPDVSFIRIVGNKYFTMEPLDSVLKHCRADEKITSDKTGKELFSKLCVELEKVRLGKEEFVKSLCEDIFAFENFERLRENIEKFIIMNFSIRPK